MVNGLECHHQAADWLGNIRSSVIAWGIPTAAMIGSGLAFLSLRMIIWVTALIWMGTACILNASKCGRTHCRFTGPFLLLMAVPVLLHGLGIASFGALGWWGLGLTILLGNAVLWWGSEALWGKFWLSGTRKADDRDGARS